MERKKHKPELLADVAVSRMGGPLMFVDESVEPPIAENPRTTVTPKKKGAAKGKRRLSSDGPSEKPEGPSKGAIRLNLRRKTVNTLMAELTSELYLNEQIGKAEKSQTRVLEAAVSLILAHQVTLPLPIEEYDSILEECLNGDLLADLIMVVSGGGVVVKATTRTAAMLGISPNELVGCRLKDLVGSDGGGRASVIDRLKQIRHLSSKGDSIIKCQMGSPENVAKRQGVSWYEVALRGIKERCPTASAFVLLLGRQISLFPGIATSMVHVRPSLSDLPRFYRVFAVHAVDGTVVRIWSANGWNLMCGYHAEEVVSRCPYIYVHPEDVEGVKSAHREVVQGGQAMLCCNRLQSLHHTWVMSQNLMIPCVNRSTGAVDCYVSEGLHVDELSPIPMPSMVDRNELLDRGPVVYDSVDELTNKIEQMVLDAGKEWLRQHEREDARLEHQALNELARYKVVFGRGPDGIGSDITMVTGQVDCMDPHRHTYYFLQGRIIGNHSIPQHSGRPGGIYENHTGYYGRYGGVPNNTRGWLNETRPPISSISGASVISGTLSANESVGIDSPFIRPSNHHRSKDGGMAVGRSHSGPVQPSTSTRPGPQRSWTPHSTGDHTSVSESDGGGTDYSLIGKSGADSRSAVETDIILQSFREMAWKVAETEEQNRLQHNRDSEIGSQTILPIASNVVGQIPNHWNDPFTAPLQRNNRPLTHFNANAQFANEQAHPESFASSQPRSDAGPNAYRDPAGPRDRGFRLGETGLGEPMPRIDFSASEQNLLMQEFLTALAEGSRLNGTSGFGGEPSPFVPLGLNQPSNQNHIPPWLDRLREAGVEGAFGPQVVREALRPDGTAQSINSRAPNSSSTVALSTVLEHLFMQRQADGSSRDQPSPPRSLGLNGVSRNSVITSDAPSQGHQLGINPLPNDGGIGFRTTGNGSNDPSYPGGGVFSSFPNYLGHGHRLLTRRCSGSGPSGPNIDDYHAPFPQYLGNMFQMGGFRRTDDDIPNSGLNDVSNGVAPPASIIESGQNMNSDSNRDLVMVLQRLLSGPTEDGGVPSVPGQNQGPV